MYFNQRPNSALALRDVDLEGGKRYPLSQTRDHNDMKVWLQETDTGTPVSEIVSAQMQYPESVGDLRLEQCREGTV